MLDYLETWETLYWGKDLRLLKLGEATYGSGIPLHMALHFNVADQDVMSWKWGCTIPSTVVKAWVWAVYIPWLESEYRKLECSFVELVEGRFDSAFPTIRFFTSGELIDASRVNDALESDGGLWGFLVALRAEHHSTDVGGLWDKEMCKVKSKPIGWWDVDASANS